MERRQTVDVRRGLHMSLTSGSARSQLGLWTAAARTIITLGARDGTARTLLANQSQSLRQHTEAHQEGKDIPQPYPFPEDHTGQTGTKNGKKKVDPRLAMTSAMMTRSNRNLLRVRHGLRSAISTRILDRGQTKMFPLTRHMRWATQMRITATRAIRTT
eukprot:TRINITY_DN6273_c0_g1_i1.p1 TRINITY_DN6273_c0_g1~~TRINITY_DN6273_c0_g1_i1.p1  ORF type:complete len:159 (-),score=8.97 TRINITY_DN6273_c0_g1_i1:412-888(-)